MPKKRAAAALSMLDCSSSRVRRREPGNGQQSLAAERAFPVLYVLRNIHHHRPGAPGARDLEGGTYGDLELLRIGDEENMLGHRAHHRGHGGLLEGVGTDRSTRDLAGNHDNRYRIRLAIAHWCNSVRSAGPGRD